MICEKCQNQVDEQDKYCRYCGNLLLHIDVDGQNVALTALRSICASKLFFAICVLMSVKVASDLSSFTLPVVPTLTTIFLWMLYSNAKKNVLKLEDFSKINNVISLDRVLVWVNVGFVTVLEVALFTFGKECIQYILSLNFPGIDSLGSYIPTFFFKNVDLILIVCETLGFIILIAMIVYNLMFVNKLKSFVESILLSINSGSLNDIFDAKKVKNWLYVIATLQACGALRGVESGWIIALGATAKCAASIITAIIIKETLIEKNELQ